jgi:hypothetical protein
MISTVHAFTASVLHYLMTFFFDSRHFLWRGHCEFVARTCRSGSQALFKRGLVEEEQNHSRLAGSILHTYPAPVRDEHGGSGSGVVLTTRQSNAHCAFVDAQLAQEKLKGIEADLEALKRTKRCVKKVLADWEQRIQKTGAGQKSHLLYSLSDAVMKSGAPANQFRRKKRP